MNLFIKLLELFQKSPKVVPTGYSLFHLVFFTLCIALGVLLCILFKNCSDKVFRRISLIYWIIILVSEVIKQLIFTFSVDQTTNTISGNYGWWYFPYQFCSSPLYVLPLVIFLKDCKVRDYACFFMTTFSFIAGVSVMFYPNDVFCGYTFINHQTMIHHGTQVTLGIFYFVYLRKNIKIKSFLKSLPIFVAMACVAIILNEIIANVTTDTFNMWFISRHYPCTLPILSSIYPKVPYLIFLLAYFVAFDLAAFLVNLIAYGIIKLTKKNA